MQTLRINEIFHSIQGESSYAGLPCVFIRLTGCHLRCAYCDTEYAFKEGATLELPDIIARALAYNCNLIEITGGEPLLQPRVFDLMTLLCNAGATVLVETSGACDISPCDPRVIRIMDLKTPGSGESHRNLIENFNHLRPHDEIKFVITDRTDYEWANSIIKQHNLTHRVRHILFSPAFAQPRGLEILGSPGLHIRTLAHWILEDRLPVRLQTQLHKIIWEPHTRGV
ncbi:MAG: radical SAM protein [Phycisphaerae bacterium]|nr:radical SAM protein [Phycisphaerae bacterium]